MWGSIWVTLFWIHFLKSFGPQQNWDNIAISYVWEDQPLHKTASPPSAYVNTPSLKPRLTSPFTLRIFPTWKNGSWPVFTGKSTIQNGLVSLKYCSLTILPCELLLEFYALYKTCLWIYWCSTYACRGQKLPEPLTQDLEGSELTCGWQNQTQVLGKRSECSYLLGQLCGRPPQI